MLAKLLKYDLKKHISFFLIIDVIAIILAVIARLTSSGGSAFLIFVHEFSIGAVFAMTVNALINTGMRGFVKFRASLYGDESYLTHTLPIKSSTIFWGKFLEIIIILFLNFVASGVAIIIAYGLDNLSNFFNDAFGILANGLGISITTLFIALGGILFLEIFNIIIVGFLGSILGNRKNNNRAFWSLIYGFIIYGITQIAVLVAIATVGLFNNDIFSVFASNMNGFTPDVMRTLFIVVFVVYLFMPAVLGLISVKCLNRGVDVE